jgi:hypothetical protein
MDYEYQKEETVQSEEAFREKDGWDEEKVKH